MTGPTDADALVTYLERTGLAAHFVGIGGAGMAPLAAIMAEAGWRVSGCDLGSSAITEQLAASGIPVARGHDPSHVADQELLVVSSAVPADAPEVAAAREVGIPVAKRAQLVGALTHRTRAICIAGTAGKTTTTAMTAVALIGAGADPSVLVGGAVPGVGVGGRAGRGDLLIVESDEYDRSFLNFRPYVAVVTNVETDHLDCYADLADIQAAFRAFLSTVPSGGATIVCADDPGALAVAPPGAIRYGEAEAAHWRIRALRPSDAGTEVDVDRPDGRRLSLRLAVPGRHNVLNAVAALAVCGVLGADLETAAAALAEFRGAARRFELKGEVSGIAVYDDYAHHPTKVRAALAGARQRARGRVWCLFQPHTFHRTASLWDDFLTAFAGADQVVLLDVYSPPGRERPMPDVTSGRLAAAMHHPAARYAPSPDAALELIAAEARPGDLVITMGAGDVTALGPRLLARIAKRKAVVH
jgi:UDP-N-acetylmuramate--alanine ligase